MTTLGQHFSRTLVTGGSQGLGNAFTKMLLAEGLHVHVLSRTPPTDIPSSPRLHFTSIDLSKENEVLQWIQKAKQDELSFDLFINNAGSGALFPFEDLPLNTLDSQIQLLLKAPLLLIQFIYKNMCVHRKGTIVNISSLAAELPIPYMSLYNAAKAAISSLTDSLVLETYNTSIKILELQLGEFKTNFHNALEVSKNLIHDNKPLSNAYNKMTLLQAHAPSTSYCVKKLRKLLIQNKSGAFRIGSFFQTKLATLFCRCLPTSLKLQLLRHYYGLHKK